MVSFTAKIATYIRKHGLITPGDRIGVAVSGGADSVALLRALLELRGELGCVLAAVHFNHKIRPEADSDAEFVESLAKEYGLEFFGGVGDARKLAEQRRMSLETAARELRYGFFSSLSFNKVATAHTLDDQAETVLMKLLRGAGTRGLSGIWPQIRKQESQSPRHGPSTRAMRSLGMTNIEIVRPMLGVRRGEVEDYLRSLGQEWREDATNLDVKHTRNKVRHELLPLLEAEYNPNIYQQLADAAEVARAEEEFWDAEVRDFFSAPGLKARSDLVSDEDGCATQNLGPSTRAEALARDDNFLHLETLALQPLALRRRVLRQAFEQVSGKTLDFEHTDALVRFLERRESSRLQLPERWFAVLDWPRRTLSFEERAPVQKVGTAVGKNPSKSMSKKPGKLTGRKV